MTLPDGWLKRQGEVVKTEVKTWSATKREVLIKGDFQATTPIKVTCSKPGR